MSCGISCEPKAAARFSEFAVGVVYKENDVVVYDGHLYISKKDNNIKHPSQSSAWTQVGKEQEKPQSPFPIGTILTVPVNQEMDGFIPYVEGESFNRLVYPELFKVLGTDVFSEITNNGSNDSLPIGSLVYSFSPMSTIPDGWVEVTSRVGALTKYPELKQVLKSMAVALPMESQSMWLAALEANTFPDLQGYFFTTGLTGTFADAVTSGSFDALPVVVDESNTLNPMGMSRPLASNVLKSPIVGDVKESTLKTPYVLVAHKTDNYGLNEVSMVSVGNGVGNMAPKSLAVRLLIKARGKGASNVSYTHKRVIRAF
jgi:hypothetical protein|nr:MAG TPA: chitinase C [Caudoviricetes sp.]